MPLQSVRAQSGNGLAAEAPESSGRANGSSSSSGGNGTGVYKRPVLAPPNWEATARTAPQLFPRTGLSTAAGVGGAPPNRLRVFSGTANPALAQEVACYLGLELGKMKIKRFADGEIYVQVGESIRGCDVFLIQPTTPPVNDNMMELLITVDACKRASARSITAVLPYFGYARADRKTQGREAIAAKLSANIITGAGADRVLAMDLHSGQCVGYFDIPVDHVYGDSGGWPGGVGGAVGWRRGAVG